MLKRIASLILSFIIFSSVPAIALNYDVDKAFDECYTLYPIFIENVIAKGTTKEKIIVFMGDVRDYLLNLDEPLTEDNFSKHFQDAVNSAFSLRRNIKVRDALMAAYPDAAADAVDGIISEEFIPIYETVKRFILGILTPVVSLSVKEDKIRLHHVLMPEDAMFFVSIYNEDDILIKSFVNTFDEMGTEGSYAVAYVFQKGSLAPICDKYILDI